MDMNATSGHLFGDGAVGCLDKERLGKLWNTA